MKRGFSLNEELYGISAKVATDAYGHEELGHRRATYEMKMLINRAERELGLGQMKNDVSANDEGLLGHRFTPSDAAACLHSEPLRTYRFWRALQLAILDVCDRPNHTGKVQVLYLGCGPYATLTLPAASFLSARAEFHLLDAHEGSIDYARRLVRGFGMGDAFKSFVVKDARELNIQKDLPNPPDIVVMEMMDKALLSEPQADVVRRLYSQFGDAILIPEQVDVGVMFENTSDDSLIGGVHPFVRLDRHGLWALNGFNKKTLRVEGEFPVPCDHRTCRELGAFLRTQVRIYGQHVLLPEEEAITLSVSAGHFKLDKNGPSSVRIGYNLCSPSETISLSTSSSRT